MQGISNAQPAILTAQPRATKARGATPSLPIAHDSIHFGKGKNTRKTKTLEETPETKGVDKAPKRQYWQAAKAGLKAAFNLKSLGFDFALGLALTAVVAIIPPHVHALAMLPLWMTMGVVIRAFQGTAKAL